MYRFPFVFLSCLLPLFALPAATLTADDSQPAGIPKGEVTKYTFDKSKIFPGTVRDYWVYVPKQYDPSKPACVYINQDGIQFNARAVFDELIHRKEMPVVIGIFIQPGKVKATSPQALDRFNRSYEYDGLGDNYVRFLLEELLPDVEKKTTADGRPLRLSKDGNDRCIGGSSSGAICAFTAAWERPDAFRRVFSAIGTYVGLRGGNNYPTLIRKTEPKPIRIFLQDGSNDLNIYGGDWWMANQEMERALTFAGYEVNHSWGTGGHDNRDATKVFPDAMRWLWKDWPAPMKAGAGSPQLREILLPGGGWELAATDFKSVFGLTPNENGEVFFNDLVDLKTHKISVNNKVNIVETGRNNGFGMCFGPDGRLFVSDHDKKQIRAQGKTGQTTVISEGVQGYGLVVRHDGSVYATHTGINEIGPKVWYFNPQGVKKLVDVGIEIIDATGLTVSPDQSLLYIADSKTHWIHSYQVLSDGSLANGQRFFQLNTPVTGELCNPTCLQIDRDGRLYVATRMGIQVCDQAGRVNCIIPTPQVGSMSFCFGGPNFDTLFVACEHKIYKRKMKVQGANAFQSPFKPKPPRL